MGSSPVSYHKGLKATKSQTRKADSIVKQSDLEVDRRVHENGNMILSFQNFGHVEEYISITRRGKILRSAKWNPALTYWNCFDNEKVRAPYIEYEEEAREWVAGVFEKE